VRCASVHQGHQLLPSRRRQDDPGEGPTHGTGDRHVCRDDARADAEWVEKAVQAGIKEAAHLLEVFDELVKGFAYPEIKRSRDMA
jgi:hypothetical protein